jgi:hypothetical protein
VRGESRVLGTPCILDFFPPLPIQPTEAAEE